MPLNYDFAIAEAPGSDGLARFRDPATAAALRAAPQAVQDFLAECGFAPGAHDSGAPRGAYWSTEESARLAIMERMSEALERYQLPKPSEIPEGGFNLSHLFTAMMSAEPLERPIEPPPPRPARAPHPAAVEPPAAAPPAPGRVSAGLSAAPQSPLQSPSMSAAAASAAPARSAAAAASPARPPRPPQDGPSVADLRAALTAADLPPAGHSAAAAAEPPTRPATPRPPRPGPGLELEMDFPAARPRTSAAQAPAASPPEQAAAPETPSAVTDALSEAAEGPQRRAGGGGGRLVGVLMLVVGLGLVLYAVLSLL